ncbi:heavy-metal-associated domain-containing protein [Flavobacterium sp.]
MSLLTENVIPGSQGKVFGTNATELHSLEIIKNAIQTISGIKEVIINEDVFPREITIYTSEVVTVTEIQEAVIAAGFHVIPKDSLPI